MQSLNHFKCETSLKSYKTAYSEQLLPTDYNFSFSVKIKQGLNFKIGVCKTNTIIEDDFTHENLDSMAYFSKGFLGGMKDRAYGI